MIKLFISYRSLDSAKVDTLVARMKSLKDADGQPLYSVWQDKTSILVGQDWWQAIVQGIIDCDVFIFMVSSESVKNINCRDELTYARKRNRPIIPIVLEGEFRYNPAKDKDDLDYWRDMPSELNDTRFQFLFYDGNQSKFINGLNAGVDRVMGLGLRDIPADFPPDPRDANSNDTITIYDEACDYALRLEFETARQKFQRLIDWNDALFAEDAHGWMVLLYEYEKMLRLDARQNTRHHIPPLWTNYASQFPKRFIDLFDPKDFKSRYSSVVENESEAVPEQDNDSAETSSEFSVEDIIKQFPWANIDINMGTQYNFQGGQQTGAFGSQAVYNGQDVGEVLQDATAPAPTQAGTPDAPIAIARAFTGMKNSDWTPIFKTFEVKGIKFEMCLVPPGQFMMGSENGDDNEKPVHQQTITEPYWIGVHPVTNAQWRRAVETSRGAVKPPRWVDWYYDNSKTNHPVVGVTWNQTNEFLNWLGSEWRLPTEPEWEFAARGLDNLVYPFSNEFKPELVIYSENSNKSTAAVGGRPKSASWVGAQDLSGNVWEWTASNFDVYPYKAHGGLENIMGLRGCSWYVERGNIRAASRFLSPRSHYGRGNDVGFRCVCLPSE